jgi:hypothetical protein
MMKKPTFVDLRIGQYFGGSDRVSRLITGSYIPPVLTDTPSANRSGKSRQILPVYLTAVLISLIYLCPTIGIYKNIKAMSGTL